MEYTGERVIPNSMSPRSGILLEHIARYQFAKDYAVGRVLDIACGVGYGSEILLKENPNISEYIGIDNCKKPLNMLELIMLMLILSII